MLPVFPNVSVQYLKTITYFKIVGILGVVSKNFSPTALIGPCFVHYLSNLLRAATGWVCNTYHLFHGIDRKDHTNVQKLLRKMPI